MRQPRASAVRVVGLRFYGRGVGVKRSVNGIVLGGGGRNRLVGGKAHLLGLAVSLFCAENAATQLIVGINC